MVSFSVMLHYRSSVTPRVEVIQIPAYQE
jgi:hypothetical protein